MSGVHLRLLAILAIGSFSSIGLAGQSLIVDSSSTNPSQVSQLPEVGSRTNAGTTSAGRIATRVAAALPDTVRAQLTPALFDDISQAGERFMASHPADREWFVGLGRSSHPLLGYVEAKGGNTQVSYLPFTNGAKYRAHRTKAFGMFSRDHNGAILEHFGKYLPNHDALGSRKLTVVDFSFTGATFNVARDLLQHATRAHGIPDAQVSMVALRTPEGFLRTPYSHTFRHRKHFVWPTRPRNGSAAKQTTHSYTDWQALRTG